MAFGDSFGAASVNTYTTMELPAGSIRPVVVVKDMIQGTSDMFTGGNITVCAGKCMAASALKSISQVPTCVHVNQVDQRQQQWGSQFLFKSAVQARPFHRPVARWWDGPLVAGGCVRVCGPSTATSGESASGFG